MHSNVIQIDHKCNKTGQCYPNRTYSRKRPKYKSDKNKRGGALSKKHNILSHLIERTPPQIAFKPLNYRKCIEKLRFSKN